MTTDELIKDMEKTCEQIVCISVRHILNKLKIDNINQNKLNEIFSNFNNYTIYLNDMAGQIYRRHNSSAEDIYKQVCKYLDIEWDNKSLYESRLKKINTIDDNLLEKLEYDIKKSVLEKLAQQNEEIKNSKYYKNSIAPLKTNQTS
ncbi:MAG: hypothetical protein B1H07_04855 [Campylobacteraceae bacterium 4484_166]|nr:MAG: hypothetical protein B1H07_04855 [Campylobacteraceae bacterium 4484_166]